MNSICAVLQARMTSTRMPGKSLLSLAGIPLIEHIIKRLQTVIGLDHIVMAIPDSQSEIPLIEKVKPLDITIIKGPGEDVLKRFLLAADKVEAQHIIRVCGDDPLIDRQLMKSLIDTHMKQNADYTITSDPIPLGTGTEVVKVAALKKIDKITREPRYREHVTTWFHDHFKTGIQPRLTAPTYLINKPYRLTVDTERDLTLMEKIFQRFHTLTYTSPDLEQVIHFLDSHPEIAQINANIQQKDWRSQSK